MSAFGSVSRFWLLCLSLPLSLLLSLALWSFALLVPVCVPTSRSLCRRSMFWARRNRMLVVFNCHMFHSSAASLRYSRVWGWQLHWHNRQVKLRKLFDEMYPGQVATVNVIPGEAGALHALVVQLDELDNLITRAHTINKAYYDVSEITKIPCCRCSSPDKDMADVSGVSPSDLPATSGWHVAVRF